MDVGCVVGGQVEGVGAGFAELDEVRGWMAGEGLGGPLLARRD